MKLGQHRHDPAVRALGGLSEIADQAPCLALCGAWLAAGLFLGRRNIVEAGARMLTSVLVASAIKGAVKGTVSRTRPHVLMDGGRYAFGPGGPKGGDWHSFPSGHTADAVAAARGLARVFPRAGAPAYATAFAVAAVQVPRAKHYPMDVAAGAIIGIAAEFIVAGAADALRRPRQRGVARAESRPVVP